jgi:hypothetical protein
MQIENLRYGRLQTCATNFAPGFEDENEHDDEDELTIARTARPTHP